MKDPSGQLSLAVKKLRCRAAFALTGTLMQNRMGEMWSVMDFVCSSETLLTYRSVEAGREPSRSGDLTSCDQSQRDIAMMRQSELILCLSWVWSGLKLTSDASRRVASQDFAPLLPSSG